MLLGTTATGQWAPVAGQLREAHPNGTDSIMERWDGTAWVPIPSTYDSGWRTLTAWTAAGTTTGAPLGAQFKPRPGFAGGVRIRRINSTGILSMSYLSAAGAYNAAQTHADRAVATLPSGFRPAGEIAIPWTMPVGLAAGDTIASALYYGGASTQHKLCAYGGLSKLVGDAFVALSPTDHRWVIADPIPTSLPGTPG
jgi:hypothetical protein